MKNKIIIIKNVEKVCKKEDETSMYIEQSMDECLKEIYSKEELLNELVNHFNCNLYLSIVVYFSSSKVNPSISPSLKIVDFLAKNKIEINYPTSC